MTDKYVLFTLKIERIQLLETPYDTMCRKYESTGFESRDHRLNSCYHRHIVNKNNTYLLTIPVHADDGNEDRLTSYLSLPDGWERAYRMLSYCNDDLCGRVDCSSTHFLVTKMKEPSHDGRRKTFIELPNEPELRIQSCPSYEWVNFVTDVAGIVSFWTGICPLTITSSHHITRILIRVKFKQISNSVYSCAVTVVMVVAYICQIKGLIMEYFQYATSSQLQFGSQESHSLPVIAFCFTPSIQNRSIVHEMGEVYSRIQSNDVMYDSRDLFHDDTALQTFSLFGHICHTYKGKIAGNKNTYDAVMQSAICNHHSLQRVLIE